jgi:hypothetical protein
MAELPRWSRRLMLVAATLGLGAIGVLEWMRPSEAEQRKAAGAESGLPSMAGSRRGGPSPSVVQEPPSATAVPAFGRNELFAFVRLPAEEIARIETVLPAPSREIHYVRTNTAWVAGKSSPFWRKPGEGRVVWPLPDGRALTVVIDCQRNARAGSFHQHWALGGTAGEPGGLRVVRGLSTCDG